MSLREVTFHHGAIVLLQGRRPKLCNSWRKVASLIRPSIGEQVASPCLPEGLEASHLLTSPLVSLIKAELVSWGELGQSLEKRTEEMMERCSEKAGKEHSRAWSH